MNKFNVGDIVRTANSELAIVISVGIRRSKCVSISAGPRFNKSVDPEDLTLLVKATDSTIEFANDMFNC